MNKYIVLSFFTILFLNISAQNNKTFTAKKLYRQYSKYKQFKEAKIPKFVLAAARLVSKNQELNQILKAVQKAKVISVHNPKFKKETTNLFNNFTSQLDPLKYQPVQTKTKNLKIVKREKNNFVKEIALVNKFGPTFHYIILKGKMDKTEAEKFIKNLNDLGIKTQNAEEKIMEGLEDLLEKLN